MKRFAFLMAAAALFTFAACDDDNNNNETPSTLAEEIAGTYSGNTEVTFNFGKPVYEDQSVKITANTNGTVDVSYTAGDIWGTYELKGLEVTKSGAKYSISGEGTVTLTMSGGGSGDYEYDFTGEIVSATDAAFTFAVTIGGTMGNPTLAFKTGTVDYAAAIAGDYEGYTMVTYLDQGNIVSGPYENQTLTITANSDGTADLYYTNEDEGWNWGEYDVAVITMSRTNVSYANTYSISGDGKVSIGGMSGGAANDYDFEMEGTVVSKTNATVTIIAAVGTMGDVKIEFKTGTPPSED